MKAKSIKGKSPEEIKVALNESMKDGFKPTVAIVFISIKLDRHAICEILNNNEIEIFGATSAGEFIEGHEEDGSAVILLFELKPNTYAVIFEDIGERNLEEVSTQLAEAALAKFKRPAFILCCTSISESGEILQGKTIIRSIEKVIGQEVNIFGGMAGDDVTFSGTYVFNHEKSTDNGMIALVLDEEKINLIGMAISGWKPLGIQRKVTKSSGKFVYEIDNSPAVDMYLKYLGNEKITRENKYEIFDNVGAHYPFQVKRETGGYAMVTTIGIDREENALICESEIKEGSEFHFSMPPDFDIVQTVLDRANALKESFQHQADALLIFSCVGRRAALGPFVTEENEGLTKIWNTPMAGFFTYGEFGRDLNGRPEHHSTTCSWVALKEK